MKKSFAELDPATIDEYIEQVERQFPYQSGSEEARYLRDLHYLYRKEEILQRAAQRLQLADAADENIVPISHPGEAGAAWSEQNTLLAQPRRPERRRGFAWPKLVAVLAAVLLLVGALVGTSQFFMARSQPATAHSGSTPPTAVTASATAADTILFSDPLDQNIHNLPVDSQHFFKNGAFHILCQNGNGSATVVDQKLASPIAYTITMEEIAGDETSTANAFGMMFNYNVNSKNLETFYTFEIINNGANSQYGFYKYNQGHSYPWIQLRNFKVGKEFRGGHGSGAVNTVKAVENGSSFAFYVNGIQVGTARDTSFLPPGSVGMIVNLKGTEVAFSNMLVTRP